MYHRLLLQMLLVPALLQRLVSVSSAAILQSYHAVPDLSFSVLKDSLLLFSAPLLNLARLHAFGTG